MFEPLAKAFVAPLNHMLAQAPWARQRLAPFAGKTVQFHVFPFDYRVTVKSDGLVDAAPESLPADTSITLTPPIALRYFAGDESAWTEVTIEGDTAFAQEIGYLARHLRWDFEEDLSKVFGDVAAHRVGQSIRDMNAWMTGAGNNLAENLRDYWAQERPVIASREMVDQFNKDVDQLRDDVERLEKRIDKLSNPSR